MDLKRSVIRKTTIMLLEPTWTQIKNVIIIKKLCCNIKILIFLSYYVRYEHVICFEKNVL